MGETLPLFTPLFNKSVQIESRPEHLTGESGALIQREIMERSGIIDWLAARLHDPRKPELITYPLSDLLRTHLLLLGQGWRDQQASLRSRERFWTSESPKSTRSSTTHWCPGRPGHPAFRHNIASSLRLHTGLPYDWTPRSGCSLGIPLAPSARRVSRVASRLPGTTRLRFALHGGQRMMRTGFARDPGLRVANSARRGTTPLDEEHVLASQPTLSRLVSLLSTDSNRTVLRQAIAELAGRRLRLDNKGHRKQTMTIDVDSLPVEGAWTNSLAASGTVIITGACYHPLVASCAETGDMLDGLLRPGNVHTAEGAWDSFWDWWIAARPHCAARQSSVSMRAFGQRHP